MQFGDALPNIFVNLRVFRGSELSTQPRDPWRSHSHNPAYLGGDSYEPPIQVIGAWPISSHSVSEFLKCSLPLVFPVEYNLAR